MSKNKKPFTVCRTCGTPHVDKLFGLMLYFPTVKERNDFVEIAEQELKGATAYPVYRTDEDIN